MFWSVLGTIIRMVINYFFFCAIVTCSYFLVLVFHLLQDLFSIFFSLTFCRYHECSYIRKIRFEHPNHDKTFEVFRKMPLWDISYYWCIPIGHESHVWSNMVCGFYPFLMGRVAFKLPFYALVSFISSPTIMLDYPAVVGGGGKGPSHPLVGHQL